jgi:predicted nucleic-acid-binding Zn-ribbon protein
MLIDFDSLLDLITLDELQEEEQKLWPTPEDTPVSILDVDRLPPMNMSVHMSDPCPACGAFNMQVGDYVCAGTCWPCAYKELYEGESS